MRIALSANGRSPHAVRWANGLADRGHEVAFVWAREDFAVSETSSFRASISHHCDLSPATLGLPWRAPATRRAARRLAELLRPELVHGFYLSGNGLLASALGVHPLVLSALGSDVLDLGGERRRTTIGRVANAYRVRRTRFAVASADLVLADSVALAETIRRRVPGTATRIIRFGVEVDSLPGPTARLRWRRQLDIQDDVFVLMSSRLIRPQYNIDTIIRALLLIRLQIPNTILILKDFERFSDPVYRRLCLQLVDELGLGNDVRLVGELDRDELLELHTAADVYVSIPTTDGTSVSVLEAMAAGVAVVAGDVPGIDPEILRNDRTALLVRPDAQSLASAVIALGLDPERRRNLIRQAENIVRLHGDFDRELDRAVELYEELVRSPADSRPPKQ